jgi:hypothetical protein
MAQHFDSAPPGQGPAAEPDFGGGLPGPALAAELAGPSPKPSSPPIENLWPAGRLANSVPQGHVIDLDSREEEMYRRQPPKGVIHSENTMVCAGSRHRCIHRRPFSCQMEGGMHVVRDVHVLGPWRSERLVAEQDARTFVAAFNSSRVSGLHEALRLAHGDQVTLVSGGFELYAWELEVEMRSNGDRLARGVLYGYRSLKPPRHQFIVQGKWADGRTKAERELKQMLSNFAADPCSIVKPIRAKPY